MPRNSAGTYSLPTGNPVVSGTVIEAQWANDTMNDLANEITNSLSRTGSGGMLAPFRLADGTLGAPGIAWLNEPGTGFYRSGTGEQWAVVGGYQIMQYTQNGALVPAGKSLTINGTLAISGSMTFTSPETVRAALKAVGYTTTTGSAELPKGTTAQRDGSPASGYLRYNTELNILEVYNGTGWDTMQNTSMSMQVFSGDGATTAFTMASTPVSLQSLAVFISGVRQYPTTDYSFSGTTLTFVAAPPSGTDNILVTWLSALSTNAPADGSVTQVKLNATYEATLAKLTATQTLTNKTLDYNNNTFLNFPASTPFSNNTALAQVQATALCF